MGVGIGGPSRLSFFAHPEGRFGGVNMILLLVLGIVGLITAAAIAVIWGLLTLIGFLLIFTGCIAVILQRTEVPDMIFLVAIILGIVFIGLNYFLGQPLTIDFGPTPLNEIYKFFHTP